MKSLLKLATLLSIAAMLVTACGPQETQAPTQPPATEPPAATEAPATGAPATEAPATEAPAANVSGTIRVGSWDSAEALEPFESSIESFKTKYPDVDVQLESVPQGYGDKLLTQFAAGTAPDVIQVGDGDVAKFISQGQLEPLDPYINGDNPLDMNVFFPAVAAIGQVNGETYLLTKDYSPLVLYYNTDMFDAAGVEYPTENWTWDDFLAAAQKLTVPGQQWGVQLPDSWGDLVWYRGISPIIYQNGGQVISDDGTTTTGYLNSPEVVEALQWYVDLFKVHKVAPNKEDLAALSGVDLFQTSQVAMLWTGRWPLKDFQKNTDLHFGTAPLPMGKERANSICWAGFAMYSKSENKDAAWAFLKHITAEEGAQDFANYAFTAVQPIAEQQGLSTDPFNAPIIKDLENVKPLPDTMQPKWVDCAEKYFKEELEKVFLEDKDVQAAMDEAAAQADACIAQQ
jgi:multiple sugar transport system substrate-binding protein